MIAHLYASLLQAAHAVDHSMAYVYALRFYGLYPILMSWVWISLSLFFRRRQEDVEMEMPVPAPMVSILVPAFAEAETIDDTIEALRKLNYPNYEVIIVNDCSPDNTAEVVREYLDDPRIKLLNKQVNEGKAMALNDALPMCRGEILVVIDADIIVSPELLNYMVPHFAGTRVAAVTGNPRVRNRVSILQHLQAVEFSSIVSMQRRAQRVLGRVLTVSGAVFAVRRSALLELGGFTPHMATEDIDLTWRLQMKFWDVRYEPRAVVWMQVPLSLHELWKQRRRWARGLVQVLKRHREVPTTWKMRRMWPIFYESIFSILWSYVFVLMTAYWLLSLAIGYAPRGTSPFPNFWGMMIATTCLLQLFIGAWVDRQYDPGIMWSFPESVFYPVIYWMLMALITAFYTIPALFKKPPQVQTWRIRRGPA